MHKTYQVAVAGPATVEPMVPAPLYKEEEQATRQSVGAPNVNSLPLGNMLRIVTVVRPFMIEFKGAVSEKKKTVDITKIVLNLMKQNDH
jgi:hypothetical protein